MESVTPEEIAQNVVSELLGGNTGRDIVAALDASVMGPSYRGGMLREGRVGPVFATSRPSTAKPSRSRLWDRRASPSCCSRLFC